MLSFKFVFLHHRYILSNLYCLVPCNLQQTNYHASQFETFHRELDMQWPQGTFSSQACTFFKAAALDLGCLWQSWPHYSVHDGHLPVFSSQCSSPWSLPPPAWSPAAADISCARLWVDPWGPSSTAAAKGTESSMTSQEGIATPSSI